MKRHALTAPAPSQKFGSFTHPHLNADEDDLQLSLDHASRQAQQAAIQYASSGGYTGNPPNQGEFCLIILGEHQLTYCRSISTSSTGANEWAK